MVRIGLLPDREVERTAFLLLPFRVPRVGHQLIDLPTTKLTVREGRSILGHIEVHAAIGLISISVLQDAIHHADLFDQVCGCGWFDARVLQVEEPHDIMEAVGVLLHDLHRLQLLQPCALGDLVLTGIDIIHQVAHIGDVAHVAHFVAQVCEPAVEHIESCEAAHIAQVHIAVHGWSAHVQANERRVQRNELFLLARQRVR